MSELTLLLSYQEVARLLDLDTVLEIVERVYRCHGRSQVVFPPKLTLDLGEGGGWPGYGGFMNAMPAYLGDIDVAGIKWVGGFRSNPSNGLPYISGLIVLTNPHNGLFTAVIEGGLITALRTGAASAVFAKHLAVPTSRVLGIVGAGAQGRMQLRALSRVFDFSEVRVFDIDEARLHEFCLEMENEGFRNLAPMSDVQSVASDADILCTVTASHEPLVQSGWIKSGALVIAAGSYQELTEESILRASKIVVDNWEQATHRGALATIIKEGRLTREGLHADMGEITTGKKPARTSKDEIILAVPVGLGSIDIACAHEVYQRAVKAGAGSQFRFV
jgi:ornithine cyclodeaminase/alanine dehydrogenase